MCGNIAYDSQKDEKYIAGMQMRWEIGNIPKIKGCIFMKISWFHPIPKSWSLKKQLAAKGTFKKSRPDKSNLVKFYEDVMQEIGVFVDDAQIVASWEEKLYDDGQGPRIEIFLKEISDEARKNSGETF
jgi:Holliday junction resolvase RusA-like endonuclease